MYMKNEEFIDYPLKDLDLSKYCDPNAKLDNCKYDLYGVIHHTGSVEFGHYYATIKNDIDSDKWFMFNGNVNSIITILGLNIFDFDFISAV